MARHSKVMRSRRAFLRAEPYVPPPDAPPLKEVVRELFDKAATLRAQDERITMALRRVERLLGNRALRRIVRARIVDGVELAWSMNKRGRWRLVMRDEYGTVPIFDLEPEERLEIITSGALERLVAEVKRGEA